MAAPQQPLTFNDVFDDEDVDEPKAANSVHHIRANSSIMQLKKILGMFGTVLGVSVLLSAPPGCRQVLGEIGPSALFWPSRSLC